MIFRLALCLLTSFLLTSSVTYAVDEYKPAELDEKATEELIQELLPATQLNINLETIRKNDSSQRVIVIEHAKSNIEKAKLVVPKLRKSIQRGKSILEYPGLIAKGNINYNENSQEYTLYIGVYLLPREGREPYDFNIIFDRSGIIKDIQDVIWIQ